MEIRLSQPDLQRRLASIPRSCRDALRRRQKQPEMEPGSDERKSQRQIPRPRLVHVQRSIRAQICAVG